MDNSLDISVPETKGIPAVPTPVSSGPTSFLYPSPAEWQDYFKTAKVPAYRATQFLDWLFTKRVFSADAMSNLPKSLIEKLKADFNWTLPTLISRLDSEDGSSKLLIKTGKGQLIESVILRYEGRVSLCVSSQVGCRLACDFCQTGKLGFMRNLGRDEILAQYAIAEGIVSSEGRRISHVVFMGMGEPLDNYDEALATANRLVAKDAFGLGNRHVTLSTSGIVPRIRQLAKATSAALAVSLHSADDALRTKLMPINRRYPLTELKAALLEYQAESGRKVTIEYILIRDLTSTLAQAKALIKFLDGLSAKVNLIPFNEHPGLAYKRPDDEEIAAFQRYLSSRSVAAPVRYSRGLDVSGACGQLAAKTLENLQDKPQRRNLLSEQRA